MNRFLLVQCECGSEQVVFGGSKTDVSCPACGNEIARSTGGRAKINPNCKFGKVLG
jgi:small subunit ribosomal protein S27e